MVKISVSELEWSMDDRGELSANITESLFITIGVPRRGIVSATLREWIQSHQPLMSRELAQRKIGGVMCCDYIKVASEYVQFFLDEYPAIVDGIHRQDAQVTDSKHDKAVDEFTRFFTKSG